MVEDFFAVLMVYPLAAFQMDQHMIDEGEYRDSKKHDDLPMDGIVVANPTVTVHQAANGFPEKGVGNDAYTIDEMPRESIHL